MGFRRMIMISKYFFIASCFVFVLLLEARYTKIVHSREVSQPSLRPQSGSPQLDILSAASKMGEAPATPTPLASGELGFCLSTAPLWGCTVHWG